MKQIVSFCCVLLLGGFFFAACNHTPKQKENTALEDTVFFDSAAIRIAYLPTLDALPLLVAEEDGIFDSLKADIQLVEYKSNMDIDTAFINRRVHGALTDVFRAILLNSKNEKVKIVGKTDGVSGLITQHKLRLRRASDLPERMIAVARDEASDWMLDRLLSEANMDVAVVNRPQINDIQLRAEMVHKDMIDAAIVPEPYFTAAIVQGSRPLWSSKNKVYQTGCILFPMEVIEEREPELRLFAKAYNLATTRINAAPKGRYDGLMQRVYAISPAATDTLQLPKYEKLCIPDEKVIEEAAHWLTNRYDEADWLGFRILPTTYKTSKLINNRLTLE